MTGHEGERPPAVAQSGDVDPTGDIVDRFEQAHQTAEHVADEHAGSLPEHLLRVAVLCARIKRLAA